VAPPDAFDADLSALRNHVGNLGAWLAIWEHRAEPDATARRCANDAIGAVDAALAGLHRVRARLVAEVREADDEAAARVDALLARPREGPPGRERQGGPAAEPSRPHPHRDPAAAATAEQLRREESSVSIVSGRGGDPR
jgi:hypothetical protein